MRVAHCGRRSVELRRERRHRLIEAAVRRHGISALDLLFERLEQEFGAELGVDSRLERIIEADPAALALAGTASPSPIRQV